MKILHKYIDPEVLPVEFGGKNNVVYSHEEYSKLMVKDDIKMASFWASDTKTDHVNKVINEHSVPEVTQQSSLVAAKASWGVSICHDGGYKPKQILKDDVEDYWYVHDK